MALSKLQRMNKALAEQVEPVLRQLGFASEHPTYTRRLSDRVDTVRFMVDRAGDVGIDIWQQLPDGSWPLQPVHGPVHKDKVASYLRHRLGSTPEGGWLHRSTQGWMKSGHMSPETFPALAAESIARLREEAEPWFAAGPVIQCQNLLQQAVPVLRELGFTVGDFPEMQRRLADRTDMIGFYLDQRAQMVIEVAQVMPDGSEGPGRPPYPHAKPDHMAFFHVSPRLRRRLREPSARGLLSGLFGRGAQAGGQSPAERALAMIRQDAEPWFRSRPVYR